MRALIFIAAVLVAAPATAQVINPTPVDLVDRMVNSAVQATIPPTCPAPPADTLTGSAGTAARCIPREDATRPTVIQAKTSTTASDGTWSVTWDAPFAATPIYTDARVTGASQPYLCTVTASSATAASGRCYQLVATTLPTITTSLLGFIISPFNGAAAGLSVRVVGRQ